MLLPYSIEGEIRQTMLPVALCSSWTDYARNRKPCDRQSFLQPRASVELEPKRLSACGDGVFDGGGPPFYYLARYDVFNDPQFRKY